MQAIKKLRLIAELKLSSDKTLLPLAQSFAENSALSFGLDSKTALALALASEEIFLHLCSCLSPDSSITLESSGLGGRATLDFRFHGGTQFNMHPFNITAKRPDELSDAESMAEMGLLLAARSVTSFSLHEDAGGGMSLRLTMEKHYQAPILPEFTVRKPSGTWTIREPKFEELPFCSALLMDSKAEIPEFLKIPEKTEDMLSSGLIALLVAVQPDGLLCGLVAWTRCETGKAIESFGPYPFPSDGAPAKAIAKGLLDAVMASICKGDAPLILTRHISGEFAATHFEPLPGGEGGAFFRLLKEDEGATLWTSPEIEGLVKDACSTLYLPRNFAQSVETPVKEAHSVFFTALDRKAGRAIMRPVRKGQDIKSNIAEHLDCLRSEGFKSVSCELDLGVPWHCRFAGSLLESGFKPGVYLPLFGKADVISMDFKG